MQIIASVNAMRSLAQSLRREGRTIGFVPTMGFLHQGHRSLIERARRTSDTVVVSIFVNPLQFGPREDFDRYPRDPERDRKLCEEAGADILFMPETSMMYPRDAMVVVEVEGLSAILEGAARPGHFRGVATVVTKLFHIVQPHTAFFGQKDYQQCLVIRRLVADLDMDVEVAVLPTVREADGLAMSSRNSYLSATELQVAPVLYRALAAGERAFRSGVSDAGSVREHMHAVLRTEPSVEIGYLEIADPETLAPLTKLAAPFVIVAAVRIGRTRLIDNILIL